MFTEREEGWFGSFEGEVMESFIYFVAINYVEITEYNTFD